MMTELEGLVVGDVTPPYMIFVVVFLFFLTGLLGFLICHLLKKKGYRCRTGDMDDEKVEEEKLGGDADENEENQDTVEQILKCIIENEANMEALNEMYGKHNVCVRHDSRLRKESIGGIPPHHHTVHSGTDHNSCLLCAQVRSKKGRRQSRPPRSKQRPGEQTVFSVGRFRVTHHDKKLNGGPNPLVSSGDQLDQSQDSEEQKEGGYNLRSMFKDVQPPSESSNGVAPNVGKRRRSLTFFGLRRGSDPAGIKVGEGAGREPGSVRFTIHQQPVVLEEQLQTENMNPTHECATNPGIKPDTDPSKNQPPASPQPVAKSPGSGSSPTSQRKIQAQDPIPTNEEGPSPEPMMKPSTGSTVSSAPSSLPIPFPASSGEAFKIMEKGGDVEEKVFKNKEAYDPGPLQTSTPIASMQESIPGFTPVIPTDQAEPESSRGFPVTQTLSDPSSTSDLEPGVGASLALISLGSSPTSSVSLLKSPTTPLSVTQSPKSSRNMPSEASKAACSPSPTPSPKYPLGHALSSQSPVLSSSFVKSTSPSPALSAASHLQTPSTSPAEHNLSIGSSSRMTFKSESVTSATSMGKRDKTSSPSSVKEQEKEGGRIPKKEEKTDIRRTGVLKTAQLTSVGGDSKTSALSPSADQLSKGGLSNQPLSPLSPLSPSSPTGSRVSNVTIIKASPDSWREFSVVTMVAEDQSSPSIENKKGETDELKSKRVGNGPADGQGTNVSVFHFGLPESQCVEMSGAGERPMGSQEKDDMVEMDDIKDCKVTQVE